MNGGIADDKMREVEEEEEERKSGFKAGKVARFEG
jgi:hypothetical protein